MDTLFVRSFWHWYCDEMEIVKAVPHRHVVLSIPKILRRSFLYDRKLLSDLSRCGWEALKLYFKKAVKGQKAVPGAVVAIQSLGDFLGFNPHLHVLISGGCFHENGMFSVSSQIDTDVLEQIFHHMVLKMLLAKGKINPDVITLMDRWQHTGFNVFCGRRILHWQKKSMENLACYIIRTSFSQERMTYHRESRQVKYQSKDSSQAKVFDALEWIAAMYSHVPGKGEQMIRYYGYYSNASRGRRKKAQIDEQIPYILEPELIPKEFRKNWVRLIQKIYEVDPLTCPKCQGSMRVVAFIEDENVVKKISKHLGLWDIKRKPFPSANAPPIDVFPAYDQPPAPTAADYLADPDYTVDLSGEVRRTSRRVEAGGEV